MEKNSAITIGVCIVTYNSNIQKLSRAVESIRFDAPDAEIVIVDNKSSDDYKAQLKQIPGIRIIDNPENSGFGSGHNIGAKALGNINYFMAVNPDVEVRPGAIGTLIGYMEDNKDVALAAPKVLNTDGTLQPLNKRSPTVIDLAIRRFVPTSLQAIPFIKKRMDYYEMLDVGYDKICEPEFISGCFMVFRKAAYDAIGGFDESFFLYFEDADITRRIRQNGRAVYNPEAVITHAWARGAHHSRKLMIIMISSAITFFNKWGWKFF